MNSQEEVHQQGRVMPPPFRQLLLLEAVLASSLQGDMALAAKTQSMLRVNGRVTDRAQTSGSWTRRLADQTMCRLVSNMAIRPKMNHGVAFFPSRLMFVETREKMVMWQGNI